MKVFVIGATGLIGSAAARCIRKAGHEVVGLARSTEAEANLRKWDIIPLAGDAEDSAALLRGTLTADATIFAPSLGELETKIVDRLLFEISGTGKTFVFTSGTGVLGQRTGGEWSEDNFGEDDTFTPLKQLTGRHELESRVRAATGIRGMVVRPPAVWSHEKLTPLVRAIVQSVRQTGSACYIGRGLNLYSHVHAEDLGEVFRAVVEEGQRGAVYHAVAGEVANRWIAETVARLHGCQTRSITMDEAIELWGKFAALVVMSVSSRSRSPRTRREFGWSPTYVDMLANSEDLIRAALAG
ncbi:MAG: NAD-dependent epimerase/dehydratase family protein [Alphaproteobacteria bacterium]|nr:NAD-dependent epimerase/dehydratase family protein [Alphaproteobacteria bacterium]